MWSTMSARRLSLSTVSAARSNKTEQKILFCDRRACPSINERTPSITKQRCEWYDTVPMLECSRTPTSPPSFFTGPFWSDQKSKYVYVRSIQASPAARTQRPDPTRHTQCHQPRPGPAYPPTRPASKRPQPPGRDGKLSIPTRGGRSEGPPSARASRPLASPRTRGRLLLRPPLDLDSRRIVVILFFLFDVRTFFWIGHPVVPRLLRRTAAPRC